MSFSDLAVAVGPQPRGEKYLEVSFLDYKVVVFGQKRLYSCKVVVFGQSGCIRAEVVVFRQKWLYLVKSG